MEILQENPVVRLTANSSLVEEHALKQAADLTESFPQGSVEQVVLHPDLHLASSIPVG